MARQIGHCLPASTEAGRLRRSGAIAILFSLTMTANAAEPRFNPSGPDADRFGAARNYPVGDRHTWRETPYLIGSFSRFDTIFPVNRVTRSPAPWNFLRAEKEPQIRYDFGGKSHTLDDYLAHFPVTGILLLQGDTILLERYQYGRTDSDRFTSASMSKSIMALLVGIALGEGRIHSLEDNASRYVPELKGTLYGETSLRALLQMSSGVEFDEIVNGVKADTRTRRLMDGMFTRGANPIALLAACKRRAFPTGTHFDYSSGDNETTGIVLRRATGKSLSEYLSEKLWQPIGAESDATWWVDTSGQEFPSSGFNAVLRDYARLGRLLAHDGAWNGRQIVPKSYLVASTTSRPEDTHLAPGTVTPYYGYGYQFWIFPGDRRMFVLRGMNSQYVFVDPQTKLVLVQTAVRSEGSNSENGNSECMALWLAIARQFGGGAKE
jgi:CubicO group peptidase (beta-lactamase class C family)